MKDERDRARIARLLDALCDGPDRALQPLSDDRYAVADAQGERPATIPAPLLRRLVSAGLLRRDADRAYRATTAARAWLARRQASSRPHHNQHAQIIRSNGRHTPSNGSVVEVNADESPIGKLARRTGRDGRPFLSPDAVKAAERLRGDFERAQLQPRLTADWSAAARPRRRSGGAGGIAELTEVAIEARGRFNRAIAVVGPEFSGVLTDVCCFLKGLETVERERGWPARSAKLVLGLALAALARHYGLEEQASGPPAARHIRHWGDEGYRPKIDG